MDSQTVRPTDRTIRQKEVRILLYLNPSLMQSKRKSLIESVTQTAIGLITSFIIQVILYPLMDIPVTLTQNVIITFVFFTVSIIRGYFVRRFFNHI